MVDRVTGGNEEVERRLEFMEPAGAIPGPALVTIVTLPSPPPAPGGTLEAPLGSSRLLHLHRDCLGRRCRRLGYGHLQHAVGVGRFDGGRVNAVRKTDRA